MKNKKYSSMDIVSGLNNSLRVLDTDYVDIFHLHGVIPQYFDEYFLFFIATWCFVKI